MDKTSVTRVAEELRSQARESHSGRAAHTVYGGHDHGLRQTVIALVADHGLAEHESPGEATLQVLAGDIQLSAGEEVWRGETGDLLVIPPRRHALAALTDAVVLLTVRLER